MLVTVPSRTKHCKSGRADREFLRASLEQRSPQFSEAEDGRRRSDGRVDECQMLVWKVGRVKEEMEVNLLLSRVCCFVS